MRKQMCAIVCVQACVRACMHACMRACVRACMRACVRACMHARTNKRPRALTCSLYRLQGVQALQGLLTPAIPWTPTISITVQEQAARIDELQKHVHTLARFLLEQI